MAAIADYLPMSEAKMMYLQARDKRHQITIMADMALCTTDEMRDYLRSGGLDIPQHKRRVLSPPRLWTDDEVELMLREDRNGRHYTAIAAMLNRTPSQVYNKLSRIKADPWRGKNKGEVCPYREQGERGDELLTPEELRERKRKRLYAQEWRRKNPERYREHMQRSAEKRKRKRLELKAMREQGK